jgi:hypothetical protein
LNFKSPIGFVTGAYTLIDAGIYMENIFEMVLLDIYDYYLMKSSSEREEGNLVDF